MEINVAVTLEVSGPFIDEKKLAGTIKKAIEQYKLENGLTADTDEDHVIKVNEVSIPLITANDN